MTTLKNAPMENIGAGSAEKHGKPERRTKRMATLQIKKFPEELLKNLKLRAIKEGIHLNALVERMLKEGLKGERK
jgi:hypothetical protein